MGNSQKTPSKLNKTQQALKLANVLPTADKHTEPKLHRYKHTEPTSAHKSFQENLTKTLQMYDTNELDAFLTDIVDEVEKQYEKDLKLIQQKPPHSENDQLSFVPKENRISNINSSFRYLKQLGRGASCRVFKAQNISNNKLYAIKEINKKPASNAALFCQEVQLLKKLHHPNILRYYDCYVDDKYYYIATEYCSGGTMLEKIIKMKSFSERKASQYIKSILSAVHYMHSLNIVNRDIKAQNMVFDKEGKDGVLQIIDFGDSKLVKHDLLYSEFVGTVHYVPPEIIRDRSGKELKKSDLWSVGVVAYLLVCGRPPFNGSSYEEILTNIVNKKQKKLLYPMDLTASCKNFIQGLLCYDVSDRMSAADALKHEWICGGTASTKSFADDVLSCLSEYSYNSKLQNVLVNAILSELELKDKEILSEGIIRMNRRLSTMDSNSVVNYLLLHSSVNNTEWAELDDIDFLEGLDVDNILNKVEEKEKELEQLDEYDDTLKLNDDIEGNEVFDDVNSDYIYSHYCHSATTSSSSVSVSSRSSISISRFRAIMDKSDKKYDVDQVVKDLSDENGQIPLHRISSYRKRMDSTVDIDMFTKENVNIQ